MGLFLLVMAGLFSRSEDTLSTDGEGIAGRARKENGVLKKGGGGSLVYTESHRRRNLQG